MSRPAILIPVLALLFIAYQSFYVLNETQQAIITQFGKPVGNPITEAGLKFKIPFFQKVTYFEKRVMKWDGEPNEIPTNDKTFIWVDTTARWQIADPLTFLQRMGNEARAKVVLNDLIDGAVRDLVTKNNLVEVILSSDWKPEYSVSTEQGAAKQKAVKIGRDQFSELVLLSAKQVIDSYGIELLDVLVKRINYTDTVRERVYDRMISERKRIAAEKRSTGEGQKAEILGKLERELNEITSTAFKETEAIRGEADATAAKIYGDAYSVDPDFYAFYTTLESYKKVLGTNTTLVIDAKSDLYKYSKSLSARTR
jgi:membrane protease subunit HflC